MDIDGLLLKRWLGGPERAPDRLLGLMLEHATEDRGGVIERHEPSALVVHDPHRGSTRVPIAALASWVLTGVPADLKALIVGCTLGVSLEDQAQLTDGGFVPAALSRLQCVTILKVLRDTRCASMSDVHVVAGLLQNDANRKAAYALLEVVQEQGAGLTAETARDALSRIALTNPRYAAEIAAREASDAFQWHRDLFWFPTSMSYPERLQTIERIFARARSCRDLDNLEAALRFAFWRYTWDDDPGEEAARKEVAPAVENLLTRIEARRFDLGCP